MEALNLSLMIPELALIVLGLGIVVLDAWMKPENRYKLGWFAVISIAAITIYVFARGNPETSRLAAQGLFRHDGFSVFMKKVFGISAFLVALMSVDYMRREERGAGEFFSIVVFALTGMFLVSSVNDLMSLFVSLELVTLSFFVLAAFRRTNKLSGEAGIKYIITGALAAGIMLFGMAFVYGATGQIRFPEILRVASDLPAGDHNTFMFGVVLLLIGLGFKIAAIPFHVWVPDVYQGAPTPVTAFLSVGSKAAGFVLIVRVLTLMFPGVPEDGGALTFAGGTLYPQLLVLFAIICGLTLFYGNLAAIPQINIKRLLGYSSIGHAGYLLLGVVAILAMRGAGKSPDTGVTAILFYLFAYVFTNLAVFLGIIIFTTRAARTHRIDDYSGLGKRAPFLAFCMTVALLSLAGVPPLAGFFGKFYLIASVVEAASEGGGWLIALAAVGAVNVVVSMYYYLLVVKRMYIFEPLSEEKITVSRPVKLALFACVLMILVIGIFQGPFVEMADAVLATMGG